MLMTKENHKTSWTSAIACVLFLLCFLASYSTGLCEDGLNLLGEEADAAISETPSLEVITPVKVPELPKDVPGGVKGTISESVDYWDNRAEHAGDCVSTGECSAIGATADYTFSTIMGGLLNFSGLPAVEESAGELGWDIGRDAETKEIVAGTGDLVLHSALAGATFVPGVGMAGKAAQTSEKGMVAVSRWGRPGLKDGDFVMLGEANAKNWVRSGKATPDTVMGVSTGNKYAPLSSGETFYVPASTIQSPSKAAAATTWLDKSAVGSSANAALGQRTYVEGATKASTWVNDVPLSTVTAGSINSIQSIEY